MTCENQAENTRLTNLKTELEDKLTKYGELKTKLEEEERKHQLYIEKLKCVSDNLANNSVVAGYSYDFCPGGDEDFQSGIQDSMKEITDTLEDYETTIEKIDEYITKWEKEKQTTQAELEGVPCPCGTCYSCNPPTNSMETS